MDYSRTARSEWISSMFFTLYRKKRGRLKALLVRTFELPHFAHGSPPLQRLMHAISRKSDIVTITIFESNSR